MVTQTLKPSYLRALALLRGWSIYRLSKESGIKHSYLYDYMNGKRTLSDNAKRKLAVALPEGKDVILDGVDDASAA